MAPRVSADWQTVAAISAAAARFTAAGVESARLDAEILAAAALGISREGLLSIAPPMPAAARRCFDEYVARRLAREPVAYIVGRKEFFSLELEVNPAVLIPRPETETVVLTALELLGKHKTAPDLHALEIGTGSGAIAIAIAVHEPRVELIATDLSAEALAVAGRNATRHDLAGRVRFELADLWPHVTERSFDLVISNPPYIASAAIANLDPEIVRYEPRRALDGGFDGLAFYRRIAAGAASHLVSGGQVAVEVGADQADEVIAIFAASGGGKISAIKDLAGYPRVIVAHFG